ncbi:MAG TPA: M56 family metallopeptidase [Terracidiphilus sp.]|nr:M56 family metallopeptidase [Terracidiphilus sp.]
MSLPTLFPLLQSQLAAAPHTLRAFSHAAAPVVVASLWQSIALAAALAICLRLAPRISAAHRFAVWAAGFVALLSLPLLPLASHVAPAAASRASAALGSSSGPWLQLDIRWSLALGALWATASLWRAFDLLTHALHLRRLWRSAQPIPAADPRIAALAGLPAPHGRAVQLCTTRDLDRPSVIGFFAPRILIPHWLLHRLTPGELRQIVLHESEHLRRRDDWTNLLQKLCLVLFPLNPALWWMERRLCQEREMACDEGVVRVTRAPRAYAACLASLAERGLQHRTEALSLGAWQHRSELARRVHTLLLRKHALNPFATRALLAVLGCGLLCGSVELARCPQLVAFVPERPAHAQLAASSSLAQPGIQFHAAQPARLRTAALRAAAPHALRLRAKTRPASVPVRPPAASAPLEAVLHSSAPHLLDSNSPDPLVAAAHLPAGLAYLQAQNTLATANNHSGTQEWIVFTAWEQVQTTTPAAQPSTQPQASGGKSPVTAPQTSARQATTRFTVTRLIFRVLPVGSASAAPHAIPMRDGWLVLQL